ncbi:MAG: hypothetical protein KF870_14870 [Leadbetterella sp.]|nr:hypothetical protein [Leadbetterella sp.]
MKLLPFILCLCLISCGKVKQIDTSEIKEVMRNSKIKRVTEKQLLEKVSEVGEAVSARLNGNYRVECQATYEIDGHRVELYSAALTGPELLDGSIKGQLLEAYKYGIENGQPVGTNIQLLNDSLYAYSFPLRKDTYLKTTCGHDFALVILSKPQLVKQL